MKDDMSGAACVLGVMRAVAKLQPDMEVHGIIAACENMPSGSSYKPGDILTAKTVRQLKSTILTLRVELRWQMHFAMLANLVLTK